LVRLSFEHLDAGGWNRFLRFFAERLRPDGIALFTTHGRCIERWLRSGKTTLGLNPDTVDLVLADDERFGFGYRDYPGQDGYGISLSSPDWVRDRIAEVPKLQAIEFIECGWGSRSWHHNTFACVLAD